MQNSQDAFDRLQALIKGIGVAVLVSHAPRDRAGAPLHGRPMLTLEGPADGRLLFFTGASSPKVLDLKRDPHVALVYADSSSHRYVFVNGRGRLLVDRERFDKYWRPTDRLWYPGGIDDPDLRLLEVTVERAMYWTRPGLVGTAIAMATALATGDAPELGESGTLEFGPPSAADPETAAVVRKSEGTAHNIPTRARARTRRPGRSAQP
jgi:general stress protein 26